MKERRKSQRESGRKIPPSRERVRVSEAGRGQKPMENGDGGASVREADWRGGKIKKIAEERGRAEGKGGK